MTPEQLYEAGRLDDAITELNGRLRESPLDSRSRTFLFELLCFSGDFDRAEKHLDFLAGQSPDAKMGGFFLRTAIHASRERVEMFESRAFPQLGEPPAAPSGSLNGEAFTAITDFDERIGARLEVFAAGQYMWIPLKHVAHLVIEAPQKLRDRLWCPARIQTGPELEDLDLGEILIPAVTPLAFRHEDPLVRLGHTTVAQSDGGEEWPEGSKLLLVDDEPVHLLDVRELVITPS